LREENNSSANTKSAIGQEKTIKESKESEREKIKNSKQNVKDQVESDGKPVQNAGQNP